MHHNVIVERIKLICDCLFVFYGMEANARLFLNQFRSSKLELDNTFLHF